MELLGGFSAGNTYSIEIQQAQAFNATLIDLRFVVEIVVSVGIDSRRLCLATVTCIA